MTIRAYQDGDLDTAIGFIMALNAYEQPMVGDRCDARESAKAHCERVLAWVKESGGCWLMAEGEDGTVLGHIVMAFCDAPIYVRQPLRRYGDVCELYLIEEARGKGLGRALLQRAEDHARAAGVSQLRIGYVAGNDAAERTYNRFGFEPYALERRKMLD